MAGWLPGKFRGGVRLSAQRSSSCAAARRPPRAGAGGACNKDKSGMDGAPAREPAGARQNCRTLLGDLETTVSNSFTKEKTCQSAVSKRVRQNARCLKLFRKHTTAAVALGTVLTRIRCANDRASARRTGHDGPLNSPRNRCHSKHFIGRWGARERSAPATINAVTTSAASAKSQKPWRLIQGVA